MASGDPQDTNPKPSGKKGKKLSQKEQSERFVETAQELDADESGKPFERAFKKIIAPPNSNEKG